MSDRMEEAMAKGESCWKRVMSVAPEFVRAYLMHAENLLLCHDVVRGEQFTKNARDHGLQLPELPPGVKPLHHNTWVYGPKFLEQIGWVTKVVPVVTLWKSNVKF